MKICKNIIIYNIDKHDLISQICWPCYMAYFRVHSAAVSLYFFLSCLYKIEASWSNGHSGFGEVNNASILSNTGIEKQSIEIHCISDISPVKPRAYVVLIQLHIWFRQLINMCYKNYLIWLRVKFILKVFKLGETWIFFFLV